MIGDPEYAKGIDRLKFACGGSVALFAASFLLPNDRSSLGELAGNMKTLFGLLSVVLLLALAYRAFRKAN